MIKGIHISTSEMVVQKSDARSKLPNFIKGKILQAKVLDWSPKGTAQLLINGRTISAQTPMILKPGQDVELKVIQERDSVVLKLVSPAKKLSTPQISSLVSLFAKRGSIEEIAGKRTGPVRDLLYDMALKSGKSDRDFLPRLIEKSGLMWEKKVDTALQISKSQDVIKAGLDQLIKNDLKAGVIKQFSASAAGGAEGPRSQPSGITGAFLEALESFQLLNQNTSESGRFLLPFPVFSEGAFQFGQLLVDTGSHSSKNKGDKESRLIRISFLLNMTQLGPLRADFSVLKKNITGRFLLNDKPTCDYVEAMLPELANRLSAIEYNVGQVECLVAEKEEIQESSLVESLLKADDDQVLNIIV